MRSLIERARSAMKESSDMGRLITLPPEQRGVVAYAEDTFSYIQLKGYLDALWANHRVPYQYVTSDPRDPLLAHPPEGATTWFIRDHLARFMRGLECQVFLTTMPDLGRFHVPRPKSGRTVYVFHSLNSTHTAYRHGAFDNYDQFLCTGPHHVEELKTLRNDSPELSEVGYYKLDLIRSEHEMWRTGDDVELDLVLLAPSWGRENLLEAHGKEIIASLLASGFRVLVRPHPQFFHSLYPAGGEVVRSLQESFRGEESVEFELSINTQDSFHRSGLMISDWSGAAFEYALGTQRPVLFIDTPQKIFNEHWERVGLPSFEKTMREVVGELVPLGAVGSTGVLARKLLDTSGDVFVQLEALMDRVVFNPGRSAAAGARAIAASL